MNKNQHNMRAQSLNPGISASEIERKWRRYQEELEIMESARAFQAVVAVSSSGGGGGQTEAPVEPDIFTFVTELDGEFPNGTTYVMTSTGYAGVVWDSGEPEILGDGIPEQQIGIVKTNDGTPLTGTIYSCNSEGVREGRFFEIYFNSCGIASIDLTKCPGAEYLGLYNNILTSLDVSSLSQLQFLDVDTNFLESLDVSGKPLLSALYCGSNLLISLDVSNLTSLTTLGCNGNSLTSLDVSGLSLLDNLSCSDNLLTSLEASGCTSLGDTIFDGANFSSNPTLVSLNFSGCTSLTSFAINTYDLDLLTSVDLSGCTSLDSSSASLNLSSCPSLTSVNLSGCTSLVSLGRLNFRYTSPIQTLNLSNCTSLETFIISDASRTYSFVSLDFSGCSALLNINLNDESDLFPSLETINVTGCSALTDLSFLNSIVSSIDISDCVLLTSIAGSTSLTGLNASGLTALDFVSVSNNLFTDTALNSLFTSLEIAVSPGAIFITNNPGSATCDPTIAEAKGWTVTN